MCDIGIGVHPFCQLIGDPDCWKMKFRVLTDIFPPPLVTDKSHYAYSVELKPDKTFYFALITGWGAKEFGIEARGRVIGYRLPPEDNKDCGSSICLVDSITSHSYDFPETCKLQTVIWTSQQKYIDIPSNELVSQDFCFSDQQEKQEQHKLQILAETLSTVLIPLLELIVEFSHDCKFPSAWSCLLASWRAKSDPKSSFQYELPAHLSAKKINDFYRIDGTIEPPRCASSLDLQQVSMNMLFWKCYCEIVNGP